MLLFISLRSISVSSSLRLGPLRGIFRHIFWLKPKRNFARLPWFWLLLQKRFNMESVGIFMIFDTDINFFPHLHIFSPLVIVVNLEDEYRFRTVAVLLLYVSQIIVLKVTYFLRPISTLYVRIIIERLSVVPTSTVACLFCWCFKPNPRLRILFLINLF
jgi:hypothetical protein